MELLKTGYAGKRQRARDLRRRMESQQRRRETNGWPRAVAGPYRRQDGNDCPAPAGVTLIRTRPRVWLLVVFGIASFLCGLLVGAMK